MKVLVTGAAGFIGFHVASRLLARGDTVVGLDNLNDYYDPALKQARLQQLEQSPSASNFCFVKADVAQRADIDALFAQHRFERVIHLGAQAGVRYSLENPQAYIDSNVTGFLNVIEACRRQDVPHLTYASTSSVYGANRKLPFGEDQGVDHPLQFYAVTKRTNELTAHTYSHLYGLPTTGLRFFTVYGPWGRPDMALFLFTRKILAGEPIQVFNHGNHSRAFTYVDDIAEGVVRASDQIAQPNSAWDAMAPDAGTSEAPFRLLNIGSNESVGLLDYIAALEAAIGKPAVVELLPLQPGDVPDTTADTSRLSQAVDFCPQVSVRDGVGRFVSWYMAYHGLAHEYRPISNNNSTQASLT
jgi:UDP-glucuronate 4-epimerase